MIKDSKSAESLAKILSEALALHTKVFWKDSGH